MPRYGLQLVPKGAIPEDLNVGLRMTDEPAVEVPDCPECPECPEQVCEVECRGWDVVTRDRALGLVTKTFHDDDFSATGAPLVLIPQGEWCGHRRRFVFDPGTLGVEGTDYTKLIVSNDDDGETAFVANLEYALDGTFCGTLKYQIDLTDADPGSETWTDLCTTATICRPPLPA